MDQTTIANQITARHTLKGVREGIQHRLEDTIFDTLNTVKPNSNRVYVHWGACESGKTRAARNAAIRLQNAGKLAMVLHGYDYHHCMYCPKRRTMDAWLRMGIGVPKDCANDKISVYLPTNQQAVLIIDHFDALENIFIDTVVFQELEIPVLLLVSSWERALELKMQGCQVLGQAGFGRWTEDELTALFRTFPKETQDKVTDEEGNWMYSQYAALAGSPGIIVEEAFCGGHPNVIRAGFIDEEWRNGILALNGADMQGITGRFPDRHGFFLWEI
jgi:hypothetical protein